MSRAEGRGSPRLFRIPQTGWNWAPRPLLSEGAGKSLSRRELLIGWGREGRRGLSFAWASAVEAGTPEHLPCPDDLVLWLELPVCARSLKSVFSKMSQDSALVTEVEVSPASVSVSQNHSGPNSQGLQPPRSSDPRPSQPWSDPHFDAGATPEPWEQREGLGSRARSSTFPGPKGSQGYCVGGKEQTRSVSLHQAPSEVSTSLTPLA